MSGSFPERHVLMAPFGRHTRYILAGYVRHSMVIILAILSVALSIDLVPQMGGVLEGQSGFAAFTQALWFTLLRSADLFPRFITLACFLGVLWTEILHTMSRERILVWNTGRSPLRCLAPVCFLALIFGSVQFAFDGYIRPAAMATQIENHLGDKGREFDRRLATGSHWIASGNDLLLTRFEFGPPPILHDLTLYRLNENGRLYEVITALMATPSGNGKWMLFEGGYWEIPAERSGLDTQALLDSATDATAVKFPQREISLSVDPFWISVWGIYPEYLSQATLRTLVRGATAEEPRNAFRTRYQVNYANALMPGAMALLAASLALWLFPYAAPLGKQFLTLPFGYAGYLTMKTFALLGEFDYMSPTPAAWAAPFVLFTTSAIILTITERHRRGKQALKLLPG